MAAPRARAAALLLLALHFYSTLAATLHSNSLNLSNTSSSDASSLSILQLFSNDNRHADCFKPTASHRELYPVRFQDCYHALEELHNFKNPVRQVIFARRKRVGFRLPRAFQSGSCVISIEVTNDDDSDKFSPSTVHNKARELALRCTEGDLRFGGRAKVGPLMVVDVLVFGRVWPPGTGAMQPAGLDNNFVVARELLNGPNPDPLNEPSPSLTKSSVANNPGHNNKLSLYASANGADLKCYDPPLPRERVWPIDVKDCEMAGEAIVGSRRGDQKYTFSREWLDTKLYYALPATYRYRSCVVHLDMNNNSDQDTVRLSVVEATAWVLAHKCSGEEVSVERYGGWGKVAVGSKGLIKVWVYGKLWPAPAGAQNMTSLVLTQPGSSIENE